MTTMQYNELLDDIYIIDEMAMIPGSFTDKFGEGVSVITDNLVAICLYPDNPTVHHWRDRAGALCRRFTTVDITPRSKK